MATTRCTFVNNQGQRCEKYADHGGQHSFNDPKNPFWDSHKANPTKPKE